MKSHNVISLLAVLFICFASVSAQTADEVIAKYLNAIGGQEQLSKINSLYTESRADIAGMESVLKVTVLNGKGYKVEIEIMGTVITTCFTDSSGWSVNPMEDPMASNPSAVSMSEAQYNAGKDQIFIGAPFTIYADKGYEAELQGSEAIESVDATKVKLTAPDGISAVYFFDPDTGYLIKSIQEEENQGQRVENVSTYSDYRHTDGHTLPYNLTIDFGGTLTISSTVTKVEVNKPVDADVFAKPL